MIKTYLIAAAAAITTIPSTAQAAVTISDAGTQVEVGGTPAADGQVVASSAWTGSTDPLPFDVRSGFDDNTNFSVAWSQTYTAPGGSVESATLLLGLYDVDSLAAGNQIGLLTLNGIDLTAILNAIVESKPYDSLTYGLYEIALPSTTYAALLGGNLSFQLNLTGPGRVGDGMATTHNAGIIDFSRVTITTSTGTAPAVPEPGTWAMMLLGFGTVGTMARTRRRQAAIA